MSIEQIKASDFEAKVLKSDCPVLVDFYADWCGPCKALAPTLEEAATELGDKATIVKINVDENQELAGQYGIRSIPTLLVFKGGEIANTIVGIKSKEVIVAELS